MQNQENLAIAGKRSSADLVGDARTQVAVNYTVDQLFAEGGYFTPDEIELYINVIKVTPNGITYFDILFENLQAGNKITSALLPKVDRANNTYFWLQFSGGGSTKVILLFGMHQFIKDYQNGKIRPDFDGYSVIETARKLQNLV